MLQQKNIIIGGLKICYYQSEGFDKNSALVFLHGWGSRAMFFGKILEKCDNVLAIDLPGFGGSEAPQSAWSLSDYASFLEEFLKKMNIKDPILAGHSFGGSVGIKYCARQNNTKKLILIGSAGIRRKTVKKYGLFIVARIFGITFSLPGLHFLKNTVRKKFYEIIDTEDYIKAGTLAGTYKKIIGEDLRKDLEKINTPTIIIWGENDADTPIRDGKMIQRFILNSKLHIIPDAGHYVFLDNEVAFENVFLSEMQ